MGGDKGVLKLYLKHFAYQHFVDRHSGCFCFLAILNNVVMNTGVQISFLNPAFSTFRSIPRSEIAGS